MKKFMIVSAIAVMLLTATVVFAYSIGDKQIEALRQYAKVSVESGLKDIKAHQDAENARAEQELNVYLEQLKKENYKKKKELVEAKKKQITEDTNKQIEAVKLQMKTELDEAMKQLQ